MFSSAASPPSQSLTRLPNGFSVCCFVSAYGPARVRLNGALIVLLFDIIIIKVEIFTFYEFLCKSERVEAVLGCRIHISCCRNHTGFHYRRIETETPQVEYVSPGCKSNWRAAHFFIVCCDYREFLTYFIFC